MAQGLRRPRVEPPLVVRSARHSQKSTYSSEDLIKMTRAKNQQSTVVYIVPLILITGMVIFVLPDEWIVYGVIVFFSLLVYSECR